MAIKYDNCKNCHSRCVHAGKDRNFVCINGVSCKIATGKSQTNADCIRAMSDENLAWELMLWRCKATAKYHGIETQYPDTHSKILDWLQQPAEKSLKKIKKKC